MTQLLNDWPVSLATLAIECLTCGVLSHEIRCWEADAQIFSVFYANIYYAVSVMEKALKS